MPRLPFAAVGDRHHHHHAADRAVGDERLRAVEDPALPLPRRGRAHCGGVAAGVGLGEAPGAEHFPLHEPREIGRLLRVVAEHVDVGGAQAVVRGDRQRDAGIHARQLFDTDAVVHGRHRRAAVLFRELDPHQSDAGELRQQIGRELLRLVPLHDVGPHLRFRELAHRAAEDLLLFRRAEVHETRISLKAKGGR